MITAAHFEKAFDFRFEGRIPRLAFLLGAGAAHGLTTVHLPLTAPIGGAVAVSTFFIGKFLLATLAAKRLHDLGASGWWTMPLVLPPAVLGGGISLFAIVAPQLFMDLASQINWTALGGVGLVFGALTFLLGLIPGQPADNQYGPNPNGLVGRFQPGLRPPY